MTKGDTNATLYLLLLLLCVSVAWSRTEFMLLH